MPVLNTGVPARVRGRRLHRLLQIIALLRGPSSWNARKLSEHFSISRRNVHRDLAILELAGIPFHFDPQHGEGGGYRIEQQFWFPRDIGLTDEECLDLAVMAKAVECQEVPLLNRVCEARDKMLGTLPSKQQQLVKEASALFDVLSLHMADHRGCRNIMTTLQLSLLNRKQIEGTYRSPHRKSVTKVRLQPRRVLLGGQAWYLVGYCNRSHETKLYRLARFQTLKMLDSPITVNPHMNLREFLGNAWTVHRGDRDFNIEIHFDKESAELVAEVRWHHTQQLVPQKDGSLIFRATVSGLSEVAPWIMSWGPRARVIKPRELQDTIVNMVNETAQLYNTTDHKRPTRRSSKHTAGTRT